MSVRFDKASSSKPWALEYSVGCPQGVCSCSPRHTLAFNLTGSASSRQCQPSFLMGILSVVVLPTAWTRITRDKVSFLFRR